MTTTVTFETATLADALKKAEACAPRASASDQAYGTAAGLVLEVRPGGDAPIRLRSTNLEVFYDEWVDCLDAQGPVADWRIPVSKFTGIVGALPIGSGKTVTFTQDGVWLKLQSSRTRSQVHMIPMTGYPVWGPYSEDDTVEVGGLGHRISQVSWACDPKEEPFTGIFFNGTHLVAANRHRAAMVPCDVPILRERPLTVPVKVLGPVIRHAGDVRVGISGNHLTISPDAHTQIRCSVYDANIPSISAFVNRQYDSNFVVDKDLLIETINRMMSITKGNKDQVPTVKMLLGGGNLNLRVEGGKDGEWIEESIELLGQAEHFPVVLSFVPKTFTDAVGKSPDEKVQIFYKSDMGSKNDIVRVDGGGGYQSWFVQWKGLPKSEDE